MHVCNGSFPYIYFLTISLTKNVTVYQIQLQIQLETTRRKQPADERNVSEPNDLHRSGVCSLQAAAGTTL